jgi:hypothetical protein
MTGCENLMLSIKVKKLLTINQAIENKNVGMNKFSFIPCVRHSLFLIMADASFSSSKTTIESTKTNFKDNIVIIIMAKSINK